MIPAPAPATVPDLVHRQQCLDQAERCRRLAFSITDRQESKALLALADDYERSAWGKR